MLAALEIVKSDFQNKLDKYIKQLTSKHPDSLIISSDYLLGKAEGNDEVFKYLLISIIF